ncbi:MAG: hypothetical protein E6R03_12650 [Hyphomicrobiaceae bacterium]|nr:MAG: hypothetical protein E6R03_12650 [Hyphomicrobiaceae bacterium]
MNKERMRELYRIVSAHQDKLNMNVWQSGGVQARLPDQPEEFCGTAACLCGWAVWLWGIELSVDLGFGNRSRSWENAGAELLGLTHDEAVSLFYPFEYPDEAPREEFEEAIKVLEAGEPDEEDEPIPGRMTYARANQIVNQAALARLQEMIGDG